MQSVNTLARELATDAVREALRAYREDPCATPGDYDTDDVQTDADELLWQSVDGCADVIYTGRAWDIVAQHATDAQDAYRDMIGEPFPSDAETLDAMMPRLAFALIYQRASGMLADIIEREWLSALDGPRWVSSRG